MIPPKGETAVKLLITWKHKSRFGGLRKPVTCSREKSYAVFATVKFGLDLRQWSCLASFPSCSPLKAPFLRGRYPASSVLRAYPPPCRPGLPLAGFQLLRAASPAGLPVLLLPSSSMRASALTPAEADRCLCRSLPGPPTAFLLLTKESAPAFNVSRSARRSLAFRPACLLSRPRRPFVTRVLQPTSLPP